MKKVLLVLLISITGISILFSCSDKEDLSSDENPIITPTEKTYNIGSSYNVNGVQGVVYKISDNGKHGMIVSKDTLNIKWFKRTFTDVLTNANDFYDGGKNMEVIKNYVPNHDIDDFPAFKWCDAKNVGGITGWYLPAINELVDIYNVREIISSRIVLDCSWYYWSSTEYDNTQAWSIEFYNGRLTCLPKQNNLLNVIAVKAF